jgi:hypothetical protein
MEAQMETKLKENQQVKPVVDMDTGLVQFHVRGYAEPLVLDMSKLHPDIVKRAAMVGMAQVRIVDAAAIGAADDDGNIIPAEDRIRMKHDAMRALIAHYETGTADWSRAGSGGGGGAKSITVEAIARVQGISYENALEMVDKRAEKTGSTRKAILGKLRNAEAVQKAILAIRAERTPAPKVDADAELAALTAE